MIKYQLSEVKKLAGMIGSYGITDMIQESVEGWIESFNLLEKDFKGDSDKIARELLLYYCGPQNNLESLLFTDTLEDMPLYICSEKHWEAVISIWRLSIEK